jgi:hypothetical protein
MAFTLLKDLAMTTRDFPLHGCFVDFSKAFDSVSWSAIDRELRHWNAPQEYIDGVMLVMNGHQLRVRSEDELSEPIDVHTGVLQGDTLAPYLFVIIMDSILRRLPDCGVTLHRGYKHLKSKHHMAGRVAPTHNKHVDDPYAERYHSHTGPGVRLNALAYADDVLLFTHEASEMQILLTAFEGYAREVGLRINMGKGKTERFYLGSTKAGSVVVASGAPVPVVNSYKYLGVFVLDFDEDLRIRKGKAWAVMSRFEDIWQSHAPVECKRQLFRALVEPILTYGTTCMSMTRAVAQSLDGTYGRMLRTALGLPPARHSRYEWPSERLYGGIDFLSTTLKVQRLRLIGKVIKDTDGGITSHPLLQVLRMQETDREGGALYRKRRHRQTLHESLLADLGVDDMAAALEGLSKTGATATIEGVRLRCQEGSWKKRRDRRTPPETIRVSLKAAATLAASVAPRRLTRSSSTKATQHFALV